MKNNFNGKTIAEFNQVSDREIRIELDDGTDIVIKAGTKLVYDEDEGYMYVPFIEVTDI